MERLLDLVIIGAGPAGMTAAIYASRAMMRYVLLEKGLPGGEIATSNDVENYPGFKHIAGWELSGKIEEHAISLGAEIIIDEVVSIDVSSELKAVIGQSGTVYRAKSVILATGASPRKLGIPSEERFFGKGISVCATCDGALYKGRTVAVVGGGDVAIEYAIYLARMCKKVYLIHRRHELRAAKVLQAKVFQLPNVEIVWDSVVSEFHGAEYVESIVVDNKVTNLQSQLVVDCLFVAVGMDPNSNVLVGKVDMAPGGWILTDENCETSVKGVFAVGDVRKKLLRQVVTSVADGAIAVYASEKYLL